MGFPRAPADQVPVAAAAVAETMQAVFLAAAVAETMQAEVVAEVETGDLKTTVKVGI
jgi:hypothetical protein